MPPLYPQVAAPRRPTGEPGPRPYVGGARASGALALGLLLGCTPPTPAGEPQFFGADRPVTVFDVRSGLVEAGRVVGLSGLVVTVPRAPGGRDLWVQAPEGGAYGGLRLYLNSPRPELQPARGALLSVVGTVGSRAGHTVLIVDETQPVREVGVGEAAPNRVGPLADYGPWIDSLVELDATVAGCGDAAGLQPLDLGARSAPLVLDPVRAGLRLGAGAQRAGLRGVLQATSGLTRLAPQVAEDGGQNTTAGEADPGVDPAAGCAADLWSLRAAPRAGWVQLDDLVLSAVGAGEAWAQPAGGGPGLRLTAEDPAALDGALVGEALSAWGLLSAPRGVAELRLLRAADRSPTGTAASVAWTLEALAADPRLAGVVDGGDSGDSGAPDSGLGDSGLADSGLADSGAPDGGSTAGGAAAVPLAWASGALLQLGPLVTTAERAPGRVNSTAGLPIDTRLYGGAAPARQALLSVVGVLDVDLAEAALLPRGPADLVVQPR